MIAFQTARLAPDYLTVAPILVDVKRKLRFGHIAAACTWTSGRNYRW